MILLSFDIEEFDAPLEHGGRVIKTMRSDLMSTLLDVQDQILCVKGEVRRAKESRFYPVTGHGERFPYGPHDARRRRRDT